MSVSFYASKEEPEVGYHEYIREIDRVNWANMNARAMLRFLGLPENDELHGQVPLHVARRAFMTAKSQFDRRAPEIVRPTEICNRYVIYGLDMNGIGERLDQFGAFLELAMLAGAKTIYWG